MHKKSNLSISELEEMKSVLESVVHIANDSIVFHLNGRRIH